MAGLWSVKFDHTNGETRECRLCGETFHAKKPSWRCNKCLNENQKLISQKYRDKYGKKDNYPFSTQTNEAGKRFSKIRVELNKVWKTGDRELIRGHYAKQLEEAERLGIMKWIYDVRNNETIKARAIKTKNRTNNDWPDTRGYYEQ